MSRFVSAGTDADSKVPDEAWLKAQQEVEAQRKPKPSEPGQQEGGKSLYEVLQQNKGRKAILKMSLSLELLTPQAYLNVSCQAGSL